MAYSAFPHANQRRIMATITTVTATRIATSVPTSTSPSPSHTILPGLPNSRDYSGPWFRTQLLLSLSIGLFSWSIFSLLRRRWRRIYMPRALLHAAETSDPASVDRPGMFGWIVPTWKVSDRTLLDTVGLDAVVFLDFMKTSAVFFGMCAVSATVVLMPVNWTRHGSTDSDTDVPGDDGEKRAGGDASVVLRHLVHQVEGHRHSNGTTRNPTLLDIIIDPQTTTSLHLLFTYFFSLLALYLFHKNFHRFLAAKQTFSISRKSSVPARTVLVSAIPRQLRSERALKEYFEETCGWPVESVQVVRHVGNDLRDALKQRDHAMRQLEKAWWDYKGDADKGRIRLDDQVDFTTLRNESESTSGEESRLASRSVSRSRTRPPSSTGESDDLLDPFAASRSGAPSPSPPDGASEHIDVPIVIDDPDDPSPNWGEVRSSHDLPSTGHPFAVATSAESLPTHATSQTPPATRPTTRLAPASLPVKLPLIGKKVDAITHWQTKFDEAEARVRRIRKAHQADWKSDIVYARAEVQADREGETPVNVDAAEGEHATAGWLSGWMGGKDDDQGFARVRLTEEGRARVSDSENEDDQAEEGRRGVPKKSQRGGDHDEGEVASARATGVGALSLRKDQWRPSGEAFVTFESITSAELAAQVVHFPEHSQCRTELAPDPDDIVWPNMGKSPRERLVRELVVWAATAIILLFWIPPVAAVATLLSFKEIERLFPWLAHLIESSPTIGALVQTTLPSTAIIIFNAALPYVFEWLCYWQGFRSKSEIANSILKKYTIFLILTTIFIFLLVSTVWAIFLDLAGSPQKIPEKLARALTQPNARAFAMSFVLLQGIGIMPLQLLNIGSLFWIGVYRTFFRLTPRELVELYAPPSVNYGMIYPPAILVFIFTLTDSVISPLILIFGALYFSVGYMVYKYKLIYVFVNPYESTGEAWPTTFARLVWGIVLFELFMLGLFAARQSWYAATGLVPLLLGTIAWSWNVREDCKGLSRHTPLATIAAAEAERGGHERPISIRYSKKDHSMYRQIELAERLPKPWIAAELGRTDG